MALFNRKKKTTVTTDVPPELQNYYQAENREKTWMAWVLGLATLVITILLALALFFGGRWIYRQITNDDEQTTSQTAQVEESKEGESKDTSNAGNSSSSNSGSSSSQSSTSTQTPQTTTPTTGTSSTSTSTPSAATSTATGTGANGLPNTGPTDTLAIFVAVSVLAYIAHRRFSTKV